MAGSRNHSCCWNPTMHSVYVVKLMSLSHNNALCQSHVAGNNAYCPVLHRLLCVLQTHSLAEQIVMTDQSWCSWSVCVSVAVTHCTGSEVINQSWSNNNCYIFWVCVCIVAWLSGIQTTAIYGHLWADRLFHGFSHYLINRTIFGGKSNLTLYVLTWRIWWAADNASKWQMGFYWAFKGLT
jgi:hypothetical protein